MSGLLKEPQDLWSSFLLKRHHPSSRNFLCLEPIKTGHWTTKGVHCLWSVRKSAHCVCSTLHSLCSLFSINSLSSEILCVWKLFFNPHMDHKILVAGMGTHGGPPQLSHFLFLEPSANRQVAVEATEALWPGLLLGMFPRPHNPRRPVSANQAGEGSPLSFLS